MSVILAMAKVLRSVALLPWSHNLLLLSKSLDEDATLYYANEVFRSGYNLGFLGMRR